MFNLITAAVFAQEGQIQEETVVIPETTAVDPITAAEQELSWENAGAAQPVPAVSTFGILKVLLTLAVVAAAIYGIIFFIKRVSRGNMAKDPFLKVLASVPLGTNRGAHIISVGSQAWLVGAAEHGVQLIGEIQDKDILNAILLEDSRKSADSTPANGGHLPDFRALLHKLGAPAAANPPPGPESIRKRSERLKEL